MSRRALLLAGGVLTLGCASARVPPTPPVEPAAFSSCLITSDSIGPDRTITAVFEDPAEAARAGRADARDTPLRVDCEGRPFPALAVAWSPDTSGRFWTLELREPVRDSNGAAWTAAALAATWRADPEASAVLRFGGVEALVPIDARRLVIGFAKPVIERPDLLADRALGVAAAGGRLQVTLMPPGGDLRDAVDDRNTDLIQTRDPTVLEYARTRPGLTLVPLPWNRTYLLIVPAGGGVGRAFASDTAALVAGLARDAVRLEARVPEAPFWWESRDSCARRPTPPGRRTRMGGVAYRLDDPVARSLAERIVALAGTPELAAVGLGLDSFSTELSRGGAQAFVVAVPKRATVACLETAAWPSGARAIPLIETRAYAIVRRGIPPLVVEGDAAVRSRPSAGHDGVFVEMPR
ncbi:MAG TPA: hypothetical protein VMY76_14260 [Gemmatimonadales bacterium]|nr:hypothetical protein [Gemmatimonadales bacterium]